MKKFLFVLMLGVSCVASAALVPEKETNAQLVPVRAATIRRTDMAKRHAMMAKRMDAIKDNKVSDAFLQSEGGQAVKNMYGVVNKETIGGINNVIRLSTENPDALTQQMYGMKKDEIEWPETATNKLGSDQVAGKGRPAPIETEPDMLKAIAQMRMPELTGSYDSIEKDGKAIAKAYDDAMKQIEEMSHEHLGQKAVSVYMK